MKSDGNKITKTRSRMLQFTTALIFQALLFYWFSSRLNGQDMQSTYQTTEYKKSSFMVSCSMINDHKAIKRNEIHTQDFCKIFWYRSWHTTTFCSRLHCLVHYFSQGSSDIRHTQTTSCGAGGGLLQKDKYNGTFAWNEELLSSLLKNISVALCTL